MTTLTFYTHPFSRGRIARWMLEEAGLPYEEVILDYGTTMKAPAYLAINPMGKVPALRHDDTVVTENAAICLHLADLVPEKALLPPPGTAARGASPICTWRRCLATTCVSASWNRGRCSRRMRPRICSGRRRSGPMRATMRWWRNGRRVPECGTLPTVAVAVAVAVAVLVKLLRF